MLRLAIFALSSVTCFVGAQSPRSVWRNVYPNASQILAGLHTEVRVGSEPLCAIQASKEDNAELYCYNEGRCVVAHGNLNDLRGPKTEGWDCKTAGPTHCQLASGSSMEMFKEVRDICLPANCTWNGLVGTPPVVAPPPACCSAPFVNTSAGCLHPSTKGWYWCEARSYCRQLGGDAFTPDSEHSLSDVMAVVKNELNLPNSYHWMSARQVDGVWAWEAGEGQLVDPGDWLSGEPNAANECSYTHGTRMKLESKGCSSPRQILCQAKAPAC